MPTIEINLLKLSSGTASLPSAQQHTIGAPRALLVFFGIFGLLLGGTTVFSYAQSRSDDSALSRAFNNYFGAPLQQFNFIADKKLVGEERDRINILLLGVGGAGHEGSYLTDTIMIASLQPSQKRLAFISIPRDLLVEIPGYGWRKINNAGAFGEMQQAGQGPELARQVVSATFDIPIDYYVQIDFEGFAKVIDALGGVTVDVENSFTDYKYPTYDHKWRVVSFKKGVQTMDGDTALKYVRSRHSLMNNEGSDFARSKRQQKVLVAVKEKVLSPSFLLNPQKINEVLATISENLSTNLQVWEMVRLATLGRSIEISNAAHLVLDDSPESFLTSETIDGAYVLVPRSGSFEHIRRKIASIFDIEGVRQDVTGSSATVQTALPPKLIVHNGTLQAGLAAQTARRLEADGFTIESFGNAPTRPIRQTVLYDFTHGSKIPDRDRLLSAYPKALVLDSTAATELGGLSADFLLILGLDAVPNASTGLDTKSSAGETYQ